MLNKIARKRASREKRQTGSNPAVAKQANKQTNKRTNFKIQMHRARAATPNPPPPPKDSDTYLEHGLTPTLPLAPARRRSSSRRHQG